MDEYLIFEFSTQEEAQTALDTVNDIVSALWTAQGYTVDNGALIGRNAASGKDRPDACRTTGWAQVMISPDGTFYFPSPSNDPRFTGWQDEWPAGVDTGTEKLFPARWIPVSQDI